MLGMMSLYGAVRGGRGFSPTGILAVFFDSVDVWQQRARSRRDLMRLDDRALRDIGIDRASAKREASRPFWDHS